MALQLSISSTDSKVGAAFSAAYARVIFGRTFAENIVITVNFYADEQARRDGKAEFDQRHYECLQLDVSPLVEKGDHLHAPFYRWLKTQADFVGAIDV
jgi:hypothetical protein